MHSFKGKDRTKQETVYTQHMAYLVMQSNDQSTDRKGKVVRQDLSECEIKSTKYPVDFKI